VAASLLAFALPLADSASEGKDVITGMLVVGLIFVSVIVLGETSHYLRTRRKARRRPSY
jgi:hypothetical protein